MNDTYTFDTVMLIDDNNIDLYVASRIMKKNLFANKVYQFTSALEAIEYLTENLNNQSAWPQIILVDIYMPLMSGFEFIEIFNAMPSQLREYSKIYIVSSTIDEMDITRAENCDDVVAFQVKPITSNFLAEIAGDRLIKT